MKFLILTKYGSREIEAEDFDEAVSESYDNHIGWNHIMAIVKAEDVE